MGPFMGVLRLTSERLDLAGAVSYVHLYPSSIPEVKMVDKYWLLAVILAELPLYLIGHRMGGTSRSAGRLQGETVS